MADSADRILLATSPTPPPQTLTSYENLFAGLLTGMATRTLTSPFDVVKILLQVGAKGGSTVDTIKELWAADGIAAFWRGNFAGCLTQGPQSALKFFVLEGLRKAIGNKELTPGQRALMGAAAGIVSQTVVYPIDFVHTRILLDPKKYSGIFQSMATIVKEEGIVAFWSGIAPTIAGAIPFEGSQFVCYDGLVELYKKQAQKQPTPLVTCALGAIAGAVSQTAAFPFDVVRKRMMAGKAGGVSSSMPAAFAQIWKQEGIPGFFKGLTINMVKIIPYSALQYTIYGETKKAILRYKAAQGKK
jgi:solute carrier family 25 protein 43